MPKKKPVTSDIYDKTYYETWNPGYDQFKNNFKLRHGYEERFKKVKFKDKKVLDIGCGRGEFIRFAALKGAKEVVGIDYSKDAINISKKQTIPSLDKKIRKRVKAEVMNAKKLDFKDDYFDIVAMFDVVEHLHRWELEKNLSEIYRVLKPKGILIIHTSPNKHNMDIIRILIKPLGIKLKSAPYHVNEQSYFSLKKYLKDFKGKIILEKDKNYWSNQMGERNIIFKACAFVADKFLDFFVIHFVLRKLPLNLLFSTDIWYFGTKE